MGALLGLLGIYLLITLVLLAVGLSIGSLLHWLVPTVDLGMGMLIGVVTTGLTLHLLARLVAVLERSEDDTQAELEAEIRPILTQYEIVPRRRRSKRRHS
ncbi:MAG TPA: hypothetical protein VLA19_22305 [Herpetosiphonaceae bacterium]|nr:hypothetical protein [Herpetosiphonaceae bacterium]